jgi:hypothetical protein
VNVAPTPNPTPIRRTRLLWVISVLMFGLYLIGANDFVRTLTGDVSYFSSLGYGVPQLAYFANYPVGLGICGEVNIFAGLATPFLLLGRSRWASMAALLAAAAQIILLILTFGFRDRWEVFGARASLTDMAVAAFTLAVWLYASNTLGHPRSHAPSVT